MVIILEQGAPPISQKYKYHSTMEFYICTKDGQHGFDTHHSPHHASTWVLRSRRERNSGVEHLDPQQHTDGDEVDAINKIFHQTRQRNTS